MDVAARSTLQPLAVSSQIDTTLALSHNHCRAFYLGFLLFRSVQPPLSLLPGAISSVFARFHCNCCAVSRWCPFTPCKSSSPTQLRVRQQGPAVPAPCLHARAYLSPTTAGLHLTPVPSCVPYSLSPSFALPPLSADSLARTAYSPPSWQKPHTDRSTHHRLNLTSASTTTTSTPPNFLCVCPTPPL